MSVCNKLIGCFKPKLNLAALFKLPQVKDSEDNFFINICYNDRAKCEGYEPAFDCLQDVTLEEALSLIITEDECGNPTIQILANICQECADQIR